MMSSQPQSVHVHKVSDVFHEDDSWLAELVKTARTNLAEARSKRPRWVYEINVFSLWPFRPAAKQTSNTRLVVLAPEELEGSLAKAYQRLTKAGFYVNIVLIKEDRGTVFNLNTRTYTEFTWRLQIQVAASDLP